jgi:hypothetical protein
LARRTATVLLTVAVCAGALAAAPALADHQIAGRISVFPKEQFGDPEASFLASTADASKVLFGVRDKTNPYTNQVIYSRTGDTTVPISVDENGFVHPAVFFRGMSADASKVVFSSNDQLTSEDQNSSVDDYLRSNGTTKLLPGSPSIYYFSADGTHMVFSTTAQLVPADDDTHADVYDLVNGTYTLASVAPDGSNTDFEPTPGIGNGPGAGAVAITADGSGIFFLCPDPLVPEDTNGIPDLYERVGGTTKLITNWSHTGGLEAITFRRISQDGAHVIIQTGSQLDPQDNDAELDVYDVVGNQRTLRSTGLPGGAGARAFFVGATPDTSTVWFSTDGQLTPDDTDTTTDLYKNTAGATTLVSTGPTAGPGISSGGGLKLVGQANNGATSFFVTREKLVPEDTDANLDVYEQTGGTTSIVSTGPLYSGQVAEANFGGNSTDGTRVFFQTPEALVSEDSDAVGDVYERFGGATYLISASPGGSSYGGATPDGLTVFFNTSDNIGTDTDGKQDVYSASVFDLTGYARPKGATPVRLSLVPAFVACDAPNQAHGAPLAFGSCAPPTPASSNLTTGVGDGSPALAKSIGFIRIDVLAGVPGGPDDSDLRVRFSLTNVMRASDLSDYTGSLRAETSVRLTDRDGNVPSTTQDFPFDLDIPCSATADTTVGGACQSITTAEAILPGSVPEGSRSVWALGRARVLDGGPDGDSTTPDNSLFAVQGVFVP